MSGNRRSLMKVSASQYLNLTFKTDLVSFFYLCFTLVKKITKLTSPIRCMMDGIYIIPSFYKIRKIAIPMMDMYGCKASITTGDLLRRVMILSNIK